MASHLVILAVSLVVLSKGADYLVEYASRLARRLDVSELIVGLVITSVGTSLPELASSLAAALAGSSGLVIGNVVGSNIANIGLVLGVAALARPFATEQKMHDRDGFILVASAAIFLAMTLDNRISRTDAIIFVVSYVAYVGFAIRSDRSGLENRFKDFLKFVFDFEYAKPAARSLANRQHSRGAPAVPPETEQAAAEPAPGATVSDTGWTKRNGVAVEIGITALSLVAVIAGAHYVVNEAIWIARTLSVPENLIGISLVAIGTSLPELLVAIAAARKGNTEMIVGNVLGSNIANVLLIVGLAGLVRPLDVAELSVVYTIPIMLFFSIGLLQFIRTDWRIGRIKGAIAVTAYVAFLVTAFLQGWG